MGDAALFLTCLLCLVKKGIPSKGWSMHVPSEVTGEVGKTVTLPCTFTHPHNTFDKTLTAIWRVKEPYNGTVVFKCVTHSSSDLCKTTVSMKNRYKLLGNPRQNNLSLQIDSLAWNDSNRYFCRVEFSGDVHDKYESRTGIRLHLIAPPRIVNISVQTGEDHAFHASCTAEGEPLPTLTWLGPQSSNFTSASSAAHRITKELQHLVHDGKYTCTAMNSLGTAEGTVYFYKFKAGGGSWLLVLLLVALGIKLLALVVILGVGACWRGAQPANTSVAETESLPGTRPSSAPFRPFSPDNFMIANSLPRQPTHESPYENLTRRINSISQSLQERI